MVVGTRSIDAPDPLAADLWSGKSCSADEGRRKKTQYWASRSRTIITEADLKSEFTTSGGSVPRTLFGSGSDGSSRALSALPSSASPD